MLLNPTPCVTSEPDGSDVRAGSGFEVTHRRRCLPSVYRRDSINTAQISYGVVFRVLDGLESPADQAVSTPVEQPAKENAHG